MRFEVKGLDRLKNKVGKLSGAVKTGAENAVHDITQEVSGRAVSNLASSIKHGSGEIQGNVKDDVKTDSKGNIIGLVWSDKESYAYREFGTGPVGEKSDKSNISPLITPVYWQKPWFFPVSSVANDLTAIYGIPKIEIQGVMFYRTSGQPARPWLYPALKYVEENLANEIVKRNLSDAIKKGLK